MIRVKPALNQPRPHSNIAVFIAENSECPSLDLLPKQLLSATLEKARLDGFEGKVGDVAVVSADSGLVSRVIFVGLGPVKAVSVDCYRRAVGTLAQRLQKSRHKEVLIEIPASFEPRLFSQAAAEGALLGAYSFEAFKAKTAHRGDQVIKISSGRRGAAKEIEEGLRWGTVLAESTNFVRDLVNHPPSDMDPGRLSAIAQREIGPGTRIRIWNKAGIKKLGMGALLGVNRGSAKDPVFLHLSYHPRIAPRRAIGFCGKGITFDSGGLSLKPSQSMETMKDDMSGAATVIAIFRALEWLRPAVKVEGFIPITENMPGGDALKPGDVVTAYNGKTIEVLNTDAEGRLILADALSYASERGLDELIDIATLTGACTVALGPRIAGLMGNDEDFKQRIRQAAQTAGERLWELPLERDYRGFLKSQVADIKNIGPVGKAGTILAGLFLSEFVREGTPWVHLDIASTAWADEASALGPAGGTGVLVRTLLTYLNSY